MGHYDGTPHGGSHRHRRAIWLWAPAVSMTLRAGSRTCPFEALEGVRCTSTDTPDDANVHGSRWARNSTLPVPSSRILLARSSKFTLAGFLTECAKVAA